MDRWEYVGCYEVPEKEKAVFDQITGYDELTPIVSCVYMQHRQEDKAKATSCVFPAREGFICRIYTQTHS